VIIPINTGEGKVKKIGMFKNGSQAVGINGEGIEEEIYDK
jgi:hypothetical protein